jgi:hypothetical protein
MALVVEDGTGKADAESYISVADATTYHANRGNTAWASLASDTVREQLLRKATEYMVQVYRMAWAGSRMTITQALDWPRSDVPRKDVIGYGYGGLPSFYPDDEIPTEVKRACAELALKANSGPLAPDLSQAIVRQKVGPLETQYSEYSPQSKRYRSIDLMLSPFMVRSNGVSVKLVRG